MIDKNDISAIIGLILVNIGLYFKYDWMAAVIFTGALLLTIGIWRAK